MEDRESQIFTEGKEKTLPEFWHKRRLDRLVLALQQGRPVMVCGGWQSGKTTLAEAGATRVEPDQTKRSFIYVDIYVEEDVKAYQREIKRMEEERPTVVVIDEVTPNKLGEVDRLGEIAEKFNSKLIIIVNTGKATEVKGDDLRKTLFTKAKELGLNTAKSLLRDIEVISLPDPQWEEAKLSSGGAC